MDGDGDVDALAASHTGKQIFWYENDGAQNFTRKQVDIAATNAGCVFAADMDGDGDLDILASFGADDKIGWYENLGHASPHVDDGLQDIHRDPVQPPLPAPPSRPTPGSVAIIERSIQPIPVAETLEASGFPPPVGRLNMIKRLSHAKWTDILHNDLPLFGEW